MKKKQQGVALITILVMVALATILAATIAKRQFNTTENTDYLKRQNQSFMYAQSGEAFLQELLVNDAENAPNVDHLNELWAKPMPVFPIDGGYVAGVLQDESGKFNLNSLLKEDGTINESAKKWFEQLLTKVGLSPQLSEAVIDWQDLDDDVAGAMGAESAYYGHLSRPYLASNDKFYSIEQLKQVRGFEGGNFKLIEPYITAQPNVESKVNINTASGVLLASLNERLDPIAIQNELDKRKQNLQFFENVEGLWSLNAFSGVDDDVKKQFSSLLGVQSDYFRAQIEIMLNGKKQQFTSYFVRNGKNVYVNYRSLAPFNTITSNQQLN